jgi:hypothetical protein
MGPFLFHPGVSTGILEYSAELSVLLTGLVGMVWGIATLLGLLAYRHAVARTPAVPAQPPRAARDEQAAA